MRTVQFIRYGPDLEGFSDMPPDARLDRTASTCIENSRFCSVPIDLTTLTSLSFRYCTERRSVLHDSSPCHRRTRSKKWFPVRRNLFYKSRSTSRPHMFSFQTHARLRYCMTQGRLSELLDVVRKPYALLPRSDSSNSMRPGLVWASKVRGFPKQTLLLRKIII